MSDPSGARMTVSQRPPGRTSISQTGIVIPFGPHQRTRRLGSAQARNTRSGFAGNRRTSFNSRSDAALFRAAPRFLSRVAACAMAGLLLFFVQVFGEIAEALGPEGARAVHPIQRRLYPDRVQAAASPLRLRLAADQA